MKYLISLVLGLATITLMWEQDYSLAGFLYLVALIMSMCSHYIEEVE